MTDAWDVERVMDVLRGPPTQKPTGWQHWDVTKNAMARLRDEFLSSVGKPPEYAEGRGIVIPTGGKYFPSAYVTLRVLRHVGCELPVQLWAFGGRGEITDEMAAATGGLGAEWVDADAVRLQHPARVLNGWELKPYATLLSPWRYTMLLDSDCYPVVDPTPLFDNGPASFFRDLKDDTVKESAWRSCRMPGSPSGPEWESGQYAVDKVECWRPLALTMWMCEHSDFYFSHFHGDKEAYHLAWDYTRSPAWVSTAVKWVTSAYVHYGPDKLPLFQHRCRDKFTLDTIGKKGRAAFSTTPQHYDTEMHNPLLQHEGFVHRALAELRSKMRGVQTIQQRQSRWMKVRSTWAKATAFGIAAQSRGIENRKVSLEVRQQRFESCHGGPCVHRAYSPKKFHYCNLCGCGEREVARISAIGSPEDAPSPDPVYDKLDYPLLQCPIDMPGFTHA